MPSIPLHDISELTTRKGKSVSICMRKQEKSKGIPTKVSTLLLPSMSGKKANTLSPAIILFQIFFITPLKSANVAWLNTQIAGTM